MIVLCYKTKKRLTESFGKPFYKILYTTAALNSLLKEKNDATNRYFSKSNSFFVVFAFANVRHKYLK